MAGQPSRQTTVIGGSELRSETCRHPSKYMILIVAAHHDRITQCVALRISQLFVLFARRSKVTCRHNATLISVQN